MTCYGSVITNSINFSLILLNKHSVTSHHPFKNESTLEFIVQDISYPLMKSAKSF